MLSEVAKVVLVAVPIVSSSMTKAGASLVKTTALGAIFDSMTAPAAIFDSMTAPGAIFDSMQM